MDLKLKTFLVLVGFLVAATNLVQANSRSKERLLKFYPISRQQYMSILRLSRQQPTISEARVWSNHGHLANWSSTLHNSWNSLFNYTTPNSNGQVINGYPICVLKTDDLTTRRKRGARQYNYDYNYAGLQPNVVYNTYPGYSVYGRPTHVGRPPHHGHPEDNEEEPDVEDEEEVEDDDDNTADEDITIDTDSSTNGPVVNCVVVIKNNNKPTTSSSSITEETEEENSKPAYGYPGYAPYPYYPYAAYNPSNPLPPPPPGHYPYPPPAYGYPPHHYESEIEPKSRHSHIQSEYSSLNPAADAHYQQMLNEYHQHLNSLYKADA